LVGETDEQPYYYFDIHHTSLYSHFTKPQRKNRQYDVLKNIILEDIHFFTFNCGIDGIDRQQLSSYPIHQLIDKGWAV
jgi:hypothetical protein